MLEEVEDHALAHQSRADESDLHCFDFLAAVAINLFSRKRPRDHGSEARMALHKNYIDGEWVAGESERENINPSDVCDIVGVYAQAGKGASGRSHRRGQGRERGLGRIHAAAARRHSRRGRNGNSRAQGRDRPHAGARRGKAARRTASPRPCARGRFSISCAGSAAPGRRRDCVDAARRRCDDHARTLGRRRHHHAVEFPDRHPGLENRAGARLRQYRRVQARRSRARHGLDAGRDPVARRPAEGRAQSRHGPRLGRRPGVARLAAT